MQRQWVMLVWVVVDMLVQDCLRNNSQIAGGTGGGTGNESVYTDTGMDSLDHHSFSYMDTPCW